MSYIDFKQPYSRENFKRFLNVGSDAFLPEDFKEEEVLLDYTTKLIKKATKLGVCDTLGLVVFEIEHNSTNYARVQLSKEAFRLLLEYRQNRALILFVPESDPSTYRFSLVSIELSDEESKIRRTYSNPRRYSFVLGTEAKVRTPREYLIEKGTVKSWEDLQKRFSVEVLTKEFYRELSDWYAWAVTVVRFPNLPISYTKEQQIEHNSKNVIRLLTRLLFVWFLKQKDLVPNDLFNPNDLGEKVLKDFDPFLQVGLWGDKGSNSIYYKAILQNLFFATLNCPITPQCKGDTRERGFRKKNSFGQHRDVNYLMRYESLFKDPDYFLELVNKQVPFLNGGLFDCLDDKAVKPAIYIDGFTDNDVAQKKLFVPDYLFFGEEKGMNVDLTWFYGEDRKKNSVNIKGLIHILETYNFTIEENMPFDQEVSLDPELLGKVFENLLASYNPETMNTARKQTGSFYTPREIVQYMVDESLVAYLKLTVGKEVEEKCRKLMQYDDEQPTLSDKEKAALIQALYKCKILDPACGSGAFPVGVLQQMVHLLSQLDPNNEQWKVLVKQETTTEFVGALDINPSEERAEVLAEIDRVFESKSMRPDYFRKLYLIENCIFGVDIQPIAVQISKLRFFISLVVDQETNTSRVDNFGIRPLPNLETKFVAANTLISLDKQFGISETEEVRNEQGRLMHIRHKIFSTRSLDRKRELREQDAEIRLRIAELLKESGFMDANFADQMANWDPYNQNTYASFFDAEWMFGVKEGFDIVIANPPFISYYGNTGSNLSNSDKKYYVENYNSVKKIDDRINSMNLMLEKGISLLNDSGHLSFITNKTLSVLPSYLNIRKYILDNCRISYLISDLDPFEAIVDCIVFGLCKESCANYNLKVSRGDLIIFKEKNIKQIVDNRLCEFIFSDNQNILAKIEKPHNSLKDILIINRGVNIGGCFDSFLSIDKKHAEYRKYLSGTANIKKYNYTWEVEDGYMYFNENAEIELRKNGKTLALGNIERYNQERLFIPESAGTITAAYCNEDYYSSYGIMVATNIDKNNSIKYACAILNSKLITFYAEEKGILRKGNKATPHVGVKGLKCIPIYLNINQQPFVDKVDRILELNKSNPKADISVLEAEIDQMVYKLYNLTYAEVLVIDPSTPITKEEYEQQ